MNRQRLVGGVLTPLVNLREGLATASCVALVLCFLPTLEAQPKPGQVYAEDGSGQFGFKDTPIQPWSGYHVHDPDRPTPERVHPGSPSSQASPGEAPSDATILFDGTDLSQWQPSTWKVENGYVEVTEGNLVSKEEFGDCQLHVEWRTPDPPRGEIMNRGNSGVNMMGLFEIQITDSYNLNVFPDGKAAAIYGQTPPLVHAVLKPGAWQAYDIIFFAPRYEGQEMVERPRVTVLHNGVLVHHNQEIYGRVSHRRLPREIEPGTTRGPVLLGGHHNPVRFRIIWIRPL